MQVTRHWLKLMTWATAWVIGMAALAPWVSHMQAGAGSTNTTLTASWLSVCTTPDDSGQQAPADAQDGQTHCPLCLVPHLGLGPVPAPTYHVHASPQPSLLPPLFAHAPRTLFVWAKPLSRAPPSLAA